MDKQKVVSSQIGCLDKTLGSLISKLSFWRCKLLKNYGRADQGFCSSIKNFEYLRKFISLSAGL